MAKKFYVVWQGRQTGIFNDWDTCKKQIDGFNGARYKSFKTQAEADKAYSGGSSPGAGSGKAKGAGGSNRSLVKTHSSKEVDLIDASIKLFTDGGCEPNPGKAGSGVAVYRDGKLDALWYGLFEPNGTNNTAELNALHQAMLMARSEMLDNHTVAIFCDSKYSIQCIIQWAVNWKKKGWKKQGGEIKNLPLIQDMFALYQELEGKVKILHVNGHVGVEGNELADRMSILAISTKEEDFVLYKKILDVGAILAMRVG